MLDATRFDHMFINLQFWRCLCTHKRVD